MNNQKTILLLGSGELGKEFTISAKRLGLQVVACDNYAGAPAMQVADHYEVINMLDPKMLQRVVTKHKPDIIVPEIEAIRTDKLKDFERKGIQVVPTAEAAHLTMNRDAIRDVAANELKVKTARFAYAESVEELIEVSKNLTFPVVVKPVMSSSGKGQSNAKTRDGLESCWKFAVKGMRGDKKRVIVEEFIKFDLEITLLTIRQKNGKTLFLPPIGHRQERGDYQESWLPAKMTDKQIKSARKMAKQVTTRLGGAGLFGVEFFVTKDDVYFSELSPRPHDTGMVTLISQDLSEFDLHLRAILGLPIKQIDYYGPSASAVILAEKESKKKPKYSGLEKALNVKDTDIKIFGKPTTRKYRRMGVALSRGKTIDEARKLAKRAAAFITVD